jgi:molybdopterin/thiamine biosynthesis adenylyltransferase
MADHGALIIPLDLATAIADADVTSGWLGGGGLQSEQVFAVTSAQIGPETKYSGYFDQLFPHRSWDAMEGGLQEQLVLWRRIPPGFVESHRPYRWCKTSELLSELSFETAELDGKKICVCVVERHSEGPKVRTFLIESQSDSSRLLPMETIMVPQSSDPYVRIPGELTEELRGKCVTIAGAGSGGGEIALNLACAGVGHLVLFDDDRLHAENYIRHTLTKRDLGRMKIAGIRDALRERSLPTKVTGHGLNIVLWADMFRKSLAESRPDLIICATDSRDSRRLANLCSIGFGIPLVIAGILDAGRIGEILLVRPKESACYECVRMDLGATLEAPESSERSSTPYIGGEEADLQSVALRFDIGFVSSLATRVALQVLDPKSYGRLPADYLVWGREKSFEYGDPFRFDLPLSLNYVPVRMRPDCPVCGGRPADLEGVDIGGEFAKILAELDNLPA